MQSLEEQTTALLFEGLAKSTRKTYSTAQLRFLDFRYWSKRVNKTGSPLPTNERTLMLFVTALSHTLKASSIKVYLAGVRALHIEHGFDNPLANCLRILRGIRRAQGSGTRPRFPIIIMILRRLHSIINTNIYVDALIWAASCVGFFGVLRCGEFTTNSNSFDPKVHLTLDDIKFDRHDNPSRMMITIKSSKTDQFRQGYVVRIGRAHSHVCAI